VDCLRKLSEYLDTQKPEGFIFLSENQEYYSELDPCEFQLGFESIRIYRNRRTIASDSGEIILKNIKDIEIKIQDSFLGDLITVVCGAPECDEMIRNYKIISVIH